MGSLSHVIRIEMFVFINKNFTNVIPLTAKVLRLIIQLLITFSSTVILLITELFYLMESLFKKFLILITCRVKTRFVLKRHSSDILNLNFFYINMYICFFFLLKFSLICFYQKTFVQNRMINKFEYGVQISSIYANFSFTQKKNALKKQVESIFFNETLVDKPFSVKNHVAGCKSFLLKLRIKCNGVFSACFIVDFFVKTKMSAQKFSYTTELESENFKRSILEDLNSNKWPTNYTKKRRNVYNYVQSVQNQILLCKKEQRLNFIASEVFDIRNRIFSINKVFNDSKTSCYFYMGYNNSTTNSSKFALLKQTKLINLSKLLPCKIVKIKLSRAIDNKKPVDTIMLVDKVLQQMFLNFLDVLVEEKLNPGVFKYRKGRNALTAVASVYTKLSQIKYFKQICLCLVDIEKCFYNFSHNQILKEYPFPSRYDFLFSRWLTPSIVNKNYNLKSSGKISQRILNSSKIGLSVSNVLVSNAFPRNAFKKEKERKLKAQTNIFFYANQILLIGENQVIFFRYLIQLKKNLKKIGLSWGNVKTKIFVSIKSKIKFQFLGFEFLVIPNNQLKRNLLSLKMKPLFFSEQTVEGFRVIFRPDKKNFKKIKKQLKVIIRKILHQPFKKIYKSFQKINFALFNWGFFHYFSQSYAFGKRLDSYVFRYLKKILIKKFRYNGLFRPKWVAHNFLGLGKINLNGKKWQPRVLKWDANSFKLIKHVYIFPCQNLFSRLSIALFSLSIKIQEKNYYAFSITFNKIIIKSFFTRVKFRQYSKYNDLLLVFNRWLEAEFYIVRSSKPYSSISRSK